MAVTWSFYGLLKRRVPLPAVESFAAESFVLVVPAAIVVAALGGSADSIARSGTAVDLTLVALAGVTTALPLILFAFAATRVPFTVLGPLQYLVSRRSACCSGGPCTTRSCRGPGSSGSAWCGRRC